MSGRSSPSIPGLGRHRGPTAEANWPFGFVTPGQGSLWVDLYQVLGEWQSRPFSFSSASSRCQPRLPGQHQCPIRIGDLPAIDGTVKIDGVLDEARGRKPPLTPFVQHDTMAPARVSTEVRIWYDQAALYLGWICGRWRHSGDVHSYATAGSGKRRWSFLHYAGAADRYFELQWNPLGGTFDAIITNQLGAEGRSMSSRRLAFRPQT